MCCFLHTGQLKRLANQSLPHNGVTQAALLGWGARTEYILSSISHLCSACSSTWRTVRASAPRLWVNINLPIWKTGLSPGSTAWASWKRCVQWCVGGVGVWKRKNKNGRRSAGSEPENFLLRLYGKLTHLFWKVKTLIGDLNEEKEQKGPRTLGRSLS